MSTFVRASKRNSRALAAQGVVPALVATLYDNEPLIVCIFALESQRRRLIPFCVVLAQMGCTCVVFSFVGQ